MKAVVEVGASSGAGSNLSGVQNGRINRKKDVENEEIQMYLSKLKDLVPFMPKNKKLSKLEVIQYVIDYICDLQYALETHPSVNNINAAELTARLQGENGTPVTTVPQAAPNGVHRQPLGVLAPSPNTIISNVSTNSLAPIPVEHTSLQSEATLELSPHRLVTPTFREFFHEKKKATPAAEKPKPGPTLKSKTELKTSKTKTSYPQPYSLKLKSIKPKSRSSSLLDKFDHSAKKEIVSENKLDQNKFEKAKKHKSLDHVRCSALKTSETSVVKKVSNVLQQRKNSKILLRANSNQVLVPRILNSYPSKLSFLQTKNESKLQSCPEKEDAEKSQSFHAIKIINKAKRTCKCISVENNKNLVNERPVGIFNVANKNYRQASDPLVKKVNFTDPLWERIRYLNSQNYGGSSRDADAFHNDSVIKHPLNYSEIKIEDNKNYHLNAFSKRAEPFYQVFDPPKNSNEQEPPETKTMKICQCLHFHTDDGLRQFSVQNLPNSQEVGQKLFRVKYVLKKDDEDNEETENKENFTKKETLSELIRRSADSIKKKKNTKHVKKIPVRPIISNTSLSKKTENRKKIQKGSESPDTNSVYELNEYQRRIPEESVSKSRTPIFSYGFSEQKPREDEEKKKTEKSLTKLDEEPLENGYKKAKEELEILEKLFSKLNSMDRLHFKEEMASQQKKQSTDKNSPNAFCKKWRGSQVLAEKACQMLKDIEAEEEYLKEKNKLRHKIIRHVQNFIKLEFSEN